MERDKKAISIANDSMTKPFLSRFALLLSKRCIFIVIYFCGLATPTTITPTIAGCLFKTTTGQCCSIPFIYRGVTYHACTTVHNSGVLWCSLDPNYGVTGRWDNCGKY